MACFSSQGPGLLSKLPYTEHPPFAPTGREGATYRIPLVCVCVEGVSTKRGLYLQPLHPFSCSSLQSRSQVGPCQFLIYRFWVHTT